MNKHEQDFDELVSFLYPDLGKSETKAIQITLAKPDKSVIGWYPGKRQKKFNWDSISTKILKNKVLTGFTGRTYRSFHLSMKKQSYSLHWLGIDIDDLPVNSEDLVSEEGFVGVKGRVDFRVINRIHTLIPECSIRYSTSGKGLHLIFRLEKPFTLAPGIKATSIIKNTLKPFVEKLESNGIPVCCWSGGVFYLLGGKQDWVFKTEEKISINENLSLEIESRGYKSFQEGGLITDNTELNEVGKKFFDIIQQGLIPREGKPVDVYLKDLYNRCRGTQFEFSTKSPMVSTEPHVNAFLSRSGNDLRLYAFADRSSANQGFVLSFEAFKKGN